ncbi:NADP-dependent malic enzyme, partial [Psychrilyobacter sp. S5]
MSVYEESLKLHIENKGKIEVISKVSVKTKEDLSLAYSPGVAEPCKKIAANKNDVYKYTAKGNMVAVITDGTAVLGLGDIGPEAALPVMEGKAILFKEFGGVDAFPICLDTKDTEEIIRTCKLLAPSFGGINLEDIAAPKCVEIERRLIEELDIPVFHDDQHGTAIVTTAAVINSCKLLGKNISDLRVSMIGTGSAGSSIARMLKGLGVKSLYAYNSKGVVMQDKYDKYRFLVKELLDQNIIDTPENLEEDSVAGMMKGTDVFVGVSGPDMVTKDMVRSMNTDPIILAMANPTPEIMPEDALEAGAAVVGTGRSDYPNQVNN